MLDIFGTLPIAEALCKVYRPDLEAYSSGMVLNQDAIRIMKEKYGIDMSKQYSKLLKDILQCEIYVSIGCDVGYPFLVIKCDYDFNIEDTTDKDESYFINCIEKL